jgi:hypothetical protein
MIGEYEVAVELDSDVTTMLKVQIVTEGGSASGSAE